MKTQCFRREIKALKKETTCECPIEYLEAFFPEPIEHHLKEQLTILVRILLYMFHEESPTGELYFYSGIRFKKRSYSFDILMDDISLCNRLSVSSELTEITVGEHRDHEGKVIVIVGPNGERDILVENKQGSFVSLFNSEEDISAMPNLESFIEVLPSFMYLPTNI